MATFILTGKYSAESAQDASADRTEKAVHLIGQLGGKVIAMYATLGNQDLVLILDLPDTETAMRASIGLNVLTGVSFTTAPAVAVDDFDKIVSN